MSEPRVTYTALDEPRDLGWQNSSGGWYQTCIFGIYRVIFPGGWTIATPHTASPGTVGAEPIDLDLNPEFRAALIEHALKAHREGLS